MSNVITELQNCWLTRNQFEAKTNSKKFYSAKLIDPNGNEYWFKSRRGRVLFERKCDLSNAMNHAFGTNSKEEWIKVYGKDIVIEERYI